MLGTVSGEVVGCVGLSGLVRRIVRIVVYVCVGGGEDVGGMCWCRWWFSGCC